jgi:hypothetical protein
MKNAKWVIEETRGKIKKFLEYNENKNTYQNLWDTTKVMLKG